MAVHKAIYDLCKALQYNIPYDNGLCHGITLRWLEANLLGKVEQQRFEKRLELIETMPTDMLVQAIKQAQSKQGQDLTLDDQLYLDLLCFCESLLLFQSPRSYGALINYSFLSQHQIEEMSVLASSKAIEQQGSLKELYSAAFILTEAEIQTYLDCLAKLLADTQHLSQEPIGFLLQSDTHDVGLCYQVGYGWTYFNINPTPFSPKAEPISEFIPSAIHAGFLGSAYQKSPYAAFNIALLLTAHDPRCALLKEKLKTFTPMTGITQEIALRQTNSTNLLYLAASYGRVKEVKALANLGATGFS